MKKKIRKVHIDGQIWIWVVPPMLFEAYVNIYSPNNTMYRVSVCDVINEPTPNMASFFSDSYSPDLKVTPGKVKKYIIENIINNKSVQ